jgi:hypothetical protein
MLEFDRSAKLRPGPPCMPALCNHGCADFSKSHVVVACLHLNSAGPMSPTPGPTQWFPCSTTQPLCMGIVCRSAPAALNGVEHHTAIFSLAMAFRDCCSAAESLPARQWHCSSQQRTLWHNDPEGRWHRHKQAGANKDSNAANSLR